MIAAYRPLSIGFAALAILFSASAAHAVRPIKSLYTALDLTTCNLIGEDGGLRRLRCAGLPGYPVYLATRRTQSFVSVGEDGSIRRAASQTLPAVNTIFSGRSKRTTLEWRFVIRDEVHRPFALIARYFTRQGSRRGEVLVVTRITDTEACHVAYIDAVANPNAIVIARRIADDRARQFECGAEPIRVGATGKSPM